MPPDDATPPLVATRVWDLPTRLFHWLLAACVVGLVITGNIGGNAIEWHMRLGLMVGALLVFRLLWGVLGGRWSRFTSFLYSPAALGRYLRGRSLPHDRFDIGHNPLGSFSVFAVLGVLLLQVATGLVADDEIATTGPLNRFVSGATAGLATSWHKGYGPWLIYALTALHVVAIVYYVRWKRQTLVRAMWHGDKLLPAGTPPSADHLVSRTLAGLIALACAASAVWVYRLG
ncbi:MAG TPA: cytochrome b/b6 domain-containing protein [Ideonella sp.]|uniref:cytochrome b/b6 domain-containing protein n=1 Tax=Ideonella sp. TaxID=1929293 RepID=UPI002E2F54B8|nr:cytochrome b/b6 domain-containing protein [Ideonella sp.]HEX5687752.1 cytochrome b/b6 domain-containing protein [Ideonella sp.]